MTWLSRRWCWSGRCNLCNVIWCQSSHFASFFCSTTGRSFSVHMLCRSIVKDTGCHYTDDAAVKDTVGNSHLVVRNRCETVHIREGAVGTSVSTALTVSTCTACRRLRPCLRDQASRSGQMTLSVLIKRHIARGLAKAWRRCPLSSDWCGRWLQECFPKPSMPNAAMICTEQRSGPGRRSFSRRMRRRRKVRNQA